jgi:hypothetical protein
MQLAKRSDRGRRDHTGAKPNHKAARTARCPRHALPGRVDRLQQRHRILEELPSGLSQLDVASVAVQQTRAELALQRLDLSAQSRLSEMQRLSRPTEMQMLRERHKRSELGQIKLPRHEHSLSRRELDPGQR